MPLVLLHGFGGFSGVWDAVRGALPDGFHSIAYDLPGHGRSLHQHDSMTPKKAADAVLDDLTGKGVSRFHLAGHSMGGAVATLMALAAPERVASLTLFAPGGFGDEINETVLAAFGRAVSPDELAEALNPMCGDGFLFPAQALDDLSAVRRIPRQRDVLADLAGRIAKDGRQGQIPRDLLARLAMPVTIAWGDDDRLLSPLHAEGLPASFRIHRFNDAGHMLLDERPVQIAALLAARLT